jgi:HK97 family phage prohead protease
MEHKSFQSFVKEISGRTVIGIASVFGVIDSYGEIVQKGAFKKTIAENLSRIKHLWRHDSWEPPIATINELKEASKRSLPKEVLAKFPEATGGLEVTRTYLDTPRGNEILAGIQADPPAINEMSFGFDVIKSSITEAGDKSKIKNLLEVALWDTSDVVWGANPATVASKALLPFKATDPAPIDTGWSRETQLKQAEINDLKMACAWFRSDTPESKEAYLLPHHESAGNYRVIWLGVKAAMNALLSDIFIPKADLRGVYDHLVKHYEQFEQEPPSFKMVELAQNLIEVQKGELPENIAQAIKALNDLLRGDTAEPPKEALTDTTALKLRLELARRRNDLLLIEEVA